MARTPLPPSLPLPAAGLDERPATAPVGPSLIFQTLGAARLVLEDGRTVTPNGVIFPLLVRVAYSAAFQCHRDELLSLLWPGQPQARQRGNLRQTLHKARTWGVRVSLVGDTVRLDPDQVVRTFSLAPTPASFERDVILGQQPIGPFLPGFVPPVPEYQEWLERQRATTQADVRRVLVDQLRLRRDRADWTGASVMARWLLQLDPLNEDATLTLAECAMVEGSKVEALAIIDRFIAEIGPTGRDIRLPVTQLRRRFTERPSHKLRSAGATSQPFIGRTSELAQLTMLLQRARWQDGCAVLLVGPAGIGKTRLIGELSTVCQIEGMREVRLQCRESEGTRPMSAMLELLTELLTLPGALGCSPDSLRLLRRMLGMSTTEDASPGTGQAAAPNRQLEGTGQAALRGRSVKHAVVDLIGAIAEEKALFLVVEDAHWMDDESWEVLRDVAERMALLRAFLLITSRPTARKLPSRSMDPAARVEVRLHPFTRDESALLVRKLITTGATLVSPETEQWLVSASEGNPLYLQVLVSHWLSTGDRSSVPPTLQSLLDHRLGQLPPTALRVLQTISLLGPFASLDRVVEALRLPTSDLMNALEQLENSGYLDSSDATLVISHELIGRAAMGQISTLVCATLRSAIAELFEREHADAGDNRCLLEALHHLEQSGRRDTVLRFFLKHEEALVAYGRPRELLRALDRVTDSPTATPAPATTPLSAGLQRLRARLEYNSGEHARFLTLETSGLRSQADFRTISVQDAEHTLAIVRASMRVDRNVDFPELARITQHMAKAVHLPSATRVQAVQFGLILATESCDSALATALLESVTAPDSVPIANDKLTLVTMMYNTIFGSLDVARELAEGLLADALANGESTKAHKQMYNACCALRTCGPIERAITGFTACFRLATEMDAPRLAEDAAWQLAIIYRALGDNQAADRWITCLETLCASADNEIASSHNISHRCQVAILERKADRAIELLIQSRRILVPTPQSLADQAFLELGTSLLDPHWVPSEALLAVARTHYDRHSWHGYSDVFALTFFSALERVQRLPEALTMATEYLTVRRRERISVHAYLQQWISDRTG